MFSPTSAILSGKKGSSSTQAILRVSRHWYSTAASSSFLVSSLAMRKGSVSVMNRSTFTTSASAAAAARGSSMLSTQRATSSAASFVKVGQSNPGNAMRSPSPVSTTSEGTIPPS